LKRDFSSLPIDGKFKESYQFPISFTAVIPTWHGLNKKAINNPLSFVEGDIYPLNELLSSIGYHIGYCMIQLTAVSGSKISMITHGTLSSVSDFESNCKKMNIP
jgi:hypothetical protein